MALTVMLYGASSIAKQRVRCKTAAFEVQYGPICHRGTFAAVEAVFTMRPPPC